MEALLLLISSIIVLQTSYLAYRSLTPRSAHFRGAILLDTSVLIDGRIEAIARSHFMSARLVVPRSVVRELQLMADKADHDKRERARYGLDMIQVLQKLDTVTVEIYDDGLNTQGVDEQLIILAKKLHATVCTTDYNLNKVARTETIAIANVNELAHALRPVYLPGERLRVAIVQPGQNSGQGVGYLDDGTMVVIDHAKPHIGSNVEAEVVRLLQTEAGKMLFAKMVGSQAQHSSQPKPTVQRQPKKPTPKPVQAPTIAAAPHHSESPQPHPAQLYQAPQPQRPLKPRNPRHRSGGKSSDSISPEDSLVKLVNGQ